MVWQRRLVIIIILQLSDLSSRFVSHISLFERLRKWRRERAAEEDGGEKAWCRASGFYTEITKRKTTLFGRMTVLHRMGKEREIKTCNTTRRLHQMNALVWRSVFWGLRRRESPLSCSKRFLYVFKSVQICKIRLTLLAKGFGEARFKEGKKALML